jgi:hypothetical protein
MEKRGHVMFDSFEVMRKMYLGKTILFNPADTSELKIFAKVLDVNPAGMVLEPVRERCGHSARIDASVEVNGEFQWVQKHCCFYDWACLSWFCLVGELNYVARDKTSDEINDEVKHALIVAENEIKKFSYSQAGGAFQKE